MAVVTAVKPDVLSLSGNLKSFVLQNNTGVRFKLFLVGASDAILDQTFYPGAGNLITIDVKEVVEAWLSTVLLSGNTLEQTTLARDFRAEYDGGQYVFRVIRAGVDDFADTPANFLRTNFLTWQPQTKAVTYYSPEYISFYATEACNLRLTAHFNDAPATTTITLLSAAAGKAYTVNTQYAVVSGLLSNRYPAYYDVWTARADGTRLSYVQRYISSEPKSKREQWFVFVNSLGGIDTFRASGDMIKAPEYGHQIAEIDGFQEEYRIDTEHKHTCNTGRLSAEEARWLQDFFPSRKKFHHTPTSLRTIVVSEGDAGHNTSELAAFTFTFRYASDKPYLNLPRIADAPANLTIPAPDQSALFFLPPRLAEFQKHQIDADTLIPVNDPHNDSWKAITIGELKDSVVDTVLEQLAGLDMTPGGPGTGDSYWELVTQDSLGALLSQPYIQAAYPAKVNVEGGYFQVGGVRMWEDASRRALYAKHQDDGVAHIYATGGVSAYGYSGTGGSGGGGEDGGSIDLTVTGEGNVITDISINADKTLLTATRGTIAGGAGLWELVGSSYIRSQYSAHINVANGYLQIGGIRIYEDAANNALKVVSANGSAAHFYATGGVSAYGLSGTEDGGGTTSPGLADLIVTGGGNAITALTLSADKTILYGTKGSTFALQSDLASHVNNSTVHITSTERTYWNEAYTQKHTHSNKAYLDVINQNLGMSHSPTFGSFVQIGSIRLIYESSTNSIYVQKSDGTAANFYATGGVSALGLSTTSPGGGSVAWADITGKPSWIGSTKPSYAWSEITGKPNVLSSISSVGSGNVVTSVTPSGSAISVTYGTVSGGGITDPWTITGGIQIGGNNNLWVRLSGGNGIAGWNAGAMGNLYLNYTSSAQNVLINTSAQLTATGGVSSDLRLKTVLGDYTEPDFWNKISEVELKTFRYLNENADMIHHGPIAQSIKTLFPDYVYDRGDSYYGLEDSRLALNLAVIGFQKAKQRMEELQNELTELKQQLNVA